MSAAYKIRFVAVVLITGLLAACSSPARRAPPPPVETAQPAQPAGQGRAFKVDSSASLLTVLVYRGGALARAGHNHVVASHELTGEVRVPDDVSGVSFDIQVPVNSLMVDEEDLRAKEGEEFPPGVPEDAKQGTRRNMLSEALLNGERYPQIRLQSEAVHKTPEGVQAQVRVIVRDQGYSLLVPLTYKVEGDQLQVEGEIPLKQTDVGLTPFSLLGGALRVLDDMKVKIRVVARASP